MRSTLTPLTILSASVVAMASTSCRTQQRAARPEHRSAATIDTSFRRLCADSLRPTGKGTYGCVMREQVFQLRLVP